MSRLLLIRHAATAATHRSAFPANEPLDAQALADAAALAARSRVPGATTLCSPALRARQTAAAFGLDPVIEQLLIECDFGHWSGRTLDEVHAEDPDAVGSWMTDPDAAPHGGESLAAFSARVTSWVDRQAATQATVVAVTHGGVIAAAVAHSLGAPVDAIWRIRPAPLSFTEIEARDGHWMVHRMGG